MKIIQLSSACCISSATRKSLKYQLKIQGYDLDGFKNNSPKIKQEFFRKENNPLYKVGDTEQDLCLKTTKLINNFIGKINPNIITKCNPKLFIRKMHDNGCQFINIYRYNTLDRVLCMVRDFSENTFKERSMYRVKDNKTKFKDWRESDARKNLHIDITIEKILNNIKDYNSLNYRMLELFDAEEIPIYSVLSEELIGHQSSFHLSNARTSISKYIEIFKFLKIEYDEKILRESILSQCGMRESQYRHNDLNFKNFKNDDLKLMLVKAGFGGYWRD